VTPRVQAYAAEAANIHRVPVDAVLGRDTHAQVCDARRRVMLALYRDGYSLSAIGRWLGRHPSTVLHAVRS
jgi:chromosomal replication initiation ATPase DnaA